MTSPESAHNSDEAVVIIPPTPDMPGQSEAFMNFDTEGDIFTLPLTIEGTQSIPAIDPEQYARLLAKEGPIPEYAVDENTVQVDRLRGRYETAKSTLIEGMNSVNALRDEQTQEALIDKEAARVEREQGIATVEANVAQLLRAVEAYRQRDLEKVEQRFAERTQVDEQIILMAGQVAEDALKSFGNIRRELNGGSETLKLHAEQCDDAEKTAAKIAAEQEDVQGKLQTIREELSGHNETLASLREREKQLPIEKASLKAAEKTERQKLFNDIFEQNREEFEAFENDAQAILRRREEIMEQVTSMKLSSILGRIAQNGVEQQNIQVAIKSCLALITTCVNSINTLEAKASQLPGLLIAQHDSFASSANVIKSAIDRHSQVYADKSGALAPVAHGEVTITSEDAVRLNLHTLARDSQRLRMLLSERKALNVEELELYVDPVHDLPELVDAFGSEVRFGTRQQVSHDGSTEKVGEVSNKKRSRFGQAIVNAVMGNRGAEQAAPSTQRELTQK